MTIDTTVAIGLFVAAMIMPFAGSFLGVRVSVARVQERQDATEKRVNNLESTTYGNGTEGVQMRVGRAEERIDTLEEVAKTLPCRLPAPSCPH